MRRISGFPLVVTALVCLAANADAASLRVCADPNNMPFSDRSGRGFENKIAKIVAHDLGMDVAYTFAAEHEHFVKKTLDAHRCEVLIGVPVGFDEVEETRPYYASSYVFIIRKDANLTLTSLADSRLRKLRIGVHLIAGDDQPPELALAQEGIVNNVSGFMISGDRGKPDSPARLIEAVQRRQVDVAAAWGPLAGYYARKSAAPLSVMPINDTTRFAPLKFRFAIAMGVRKDDDKLKDRLDLAIARERQAIAETLHAYAVPLVDVDGGAGD